MSVAVALTLFSSLFALPPGENSKEVEKGIVSFQPGEASQVPERYRLPPHTFPYELRRRWTLAVSGIEVYELRFPSPVVTPYPENNTVVGEYYRPQGTGPFPGVLVLDILAGDQRVARLFARQLARNGIAALTIHMAYYGPRRPAGSSLRLLSPDLDHTFAAIRQTVLDLRRATAWLASRPEIHPQRLGIMGTSLGSFLAALTAEMEPKLKRVAILLGGGGFVEAFYDDERVLLLRTCWELLGGTRQEVARLLAPVDPLTYAANLRDRQVLILAARRDDIVPPRMAQALWEASGRQQLLWFDCTHYGSIVYLLHGLKLVTEHFLREPWQH